MSAGRAVRNFAPARKFTMPELETAIVNRRSYLVHTPAVIFRTRRRQRSARRFLSGRAHCEMASSVLDQAVVDAVDVARIVVESRIRLQTRAAAGGPRSGCCDH